MMNYAEIAGSEKTSAKPTQEHMDIPTQTISNDPWKFITMKRTCFL